MPNFLDGPVRICYNYKIDSRDPHRVGAFLFFGLTLPTFEPFRSKKVSAPGRRHS